MTERKQLSVGLFKKKEDCEIEDYLRMDPTTSGGPYPFGGDFEEVVNLKLEQMQNNP